MSSPRTIAIVPARAGSKGLAGKNLLCVGGMSLVARAVTVARQVTSIDEVIVSTDGEDIAVEAKRCGASVHWRPPHLAADDSPVIDTVRHVRDELRVAGHPARYGALLEPTTPLRSVADVERCVAAVHGGADSAATFTEAAVHPHRTFALEDGVVRPYIDGAVAWLPRQALRPRAYQLSGSAYAFDLERFPDSGLSFLFGRVAPVIIPRERSIDIDDEVDLRIVEAHLASAREWPDQHPTGQRPPS